MIVLAFLVLISGIILAFFTGVTTERSYSKTAADASTTQQLADSAVNVVMAQIVDATKGSDAASTTKLAWASQPGMIRTFDSTGAPGNFYKLYSSDHMSVAGAGFTTTSDVPPADWNSAANVGIYADLNTPVLVSDSTGMIKPDPSKPDTYSAVYPIIDPLAEGSVENPAQAVSGFSMSARPGSMVSGTGPVVSSAYDPTQAAPAGQTANPAPMPVKWLYVLRNGQIISPDAATSANGAVKFSGTNAALMSGSNPIVGRMAFWTDDETCKVNINTASEGIYWDVPRVFTPEDTGRMSSNKLNQQSNAIPGMAICQPVQHEYQRYPGHPATTSLSTVLGAFSPSLTGSASWEPWTGTVGAPPSTSVFNKYYAIAPRVSPGGSNGGTILTGTSSVSGTVVLSGQGGNGMTVDKDRLYASVDELMFTPGLSGSSRIPNTSATSAPSLITKSVLEKTRFFLTAGSNAPEVTLFNTPRVSMWPVWDAGSIMASGSTVVASGTGARTAFDNLAAFCGTVGGQSYYFTRKNSRSDTVDYSGRNVSLYQYLQSLTSKNIPGFGGNFASKYTSPECNQILTLIYDYIRCINSADSTLANDGKSYPYTPIFAASGTNTTQPAGVFQDVPNLFPRGAGEVVPIKINNGTMGAGRILTVSEADLLFYASNKPVAVASSTTYNISAVFMVQFASPMQGLSPMRSSLKYTVSGLPSFSVGAVTGTATSGTSASLPFPGSATNYIEISDIQASGGLGIGGVEGPAQGLYSLSGNGTDISAKALSASGGPGNYPFFSTEVSFAVPKTSPAPLYFQFHGASLAITLTTQDASPVTVQTIHLTFPDGIFKIPNYYSGTANFGNRLKNNLSLATHISNLVTVNDTLVGVQTGGQAGNDATGGDYRMIAPLSNVPDDHYSAHRDYTSGTAQFAHGMMAACGNPYYSGTLAFTNPWSGATNFPIFNGSGGTLVPTTYYGWYHNIASRAPIWKYPYVPARVGNAVKRVDGGPGDWDTGIGNTPDGAYMNKPDEGDTRLVAHTDDTVMRYPYQLGSSVAEAPPGAAYFSPNRQVPSSLMLGSIPTGVQRMKPWQTLLFNPKPEDPSHPGHGAPISGPPYATPPDHLIADWFWMPVVEPYAISQPFATAGKINLNYQIVPFTYIKRKTGLYAVMKSTKFLAIPLTDGTTYKPVAADPCSDENPTDWNGGKELPNRRHSINIDETLKACDTRFDHNDIYRSATEICDLNLVPKPLSGEQAWTASDMVTFWNNNKLTGDNVREKPYVDIYPRLTTKSNTYTVHVCVQSLKQNGVNARNGVFIDPSGTAPGAKDSVLSEYRGSTTIERYIDPNDPSLPDFATDQNANIDPYYKFRVVSTKRFAP